MEHEEMRIGGLNRAEWDAVYKLEGMPAAERAIALDRMFDGTHPAQNG